jgi:CHRD domain-containing protein
MRRYMWHGAMLAAAVLLFCLVPVRAQDYSAKLSGFEEVGGLGAGETGAVLSTGEATVKLHLDKAAETLTYDLTYSGLVNVLQSHIHFGKEHVAGGVMVFFCTNLGNGPAGTPACPDDTGGQVTVSGTIKAADVVGPTAQNVTVGDFDAIVSALASDTAYANIHTKQFPAGEIRGQVHQRHDRDDDHGKSDHGQ